MSWFVWRWLGISKVDTSIYPQQAGEDWYWIGLGVSNVARKQWDSSEIDYALSQEERLENVRSYVGDLRSDPKKWPEPWKSAYLKTHPQN